MRIKQRWWFREIGTHRFMCFVELSIPTPKDKTRAFTDQWDVYPSELEEGYWVAKSRKTGQIGIGTPSENACRDLQKCMRTVVQEAERDRRIELFESRAPVRLWDLSCPACPVYERRGELRWKNWEYRWHAHAR